MVCCLLWRALVGGLLFQVNRLHGLAGTSIGFSQSHGTRRWRRPIPATWVRFPLFLGTGSGKILVALPLLFISNP